MFYGRNEEGGLRCIYHGWNTTCTAIASTCPMSRPRLSSRIKFGTNPIHARNEQALFGSTWETEILRLLCLSWNGRWCLTRIGIWRSEFPSCMSVPSTTMGVGARRRSKSASRF
ncbi:MAG: hypothetical protein ACREQW_12460 [Candidatus Binatia bacterium]